jgi:hypothetical protein
MRAVKVRITEEHVAAVLDLAFEHDIRGATVNRVEYNSPGQPAEKNVIVDIETSTPKAKRFIDALLESDFFDIRRSSMSTRQPRAVVSSESYDELTQPLVEPATDICQELWQFSHVTVGFVGRILIGGGLLAYGIINQQLLLMIAGMLFIPLLPVLLAIGFGSWTRQWALVRLALAAIAIALILLGAAGIAVAAVSQGPVRYDDFNSLTVSLVISLAVGIAAALANLDDAGRREMIGLAATAQIAVIPVWLGVSTVLGFPAAATQHDIWERVLVLFLNIIIVTGTSLITYVALSALGGAPPVPTEKTNFAVFGNAKFGGNK